MCRTIFQFLFGFLAVILFVVGGTSLIVRDRVLREDIYINPMNEQNVYKVVAEQAISNFSTTPGTNLSSDELIMGVVAELNKGDKIKSIVQPTIENSIKYILQYFRGESDKVYFYIPGDEIKSVFSSASIKSAFISQFNKINQNYDTLPICTEVQMMTGYSDDFISTGKFTCRIPTSPTKADLDILFASQVDEIMLQANIENTLDTSLNGVNGKVSFEDLAKNTNTVNAFSTKQTVDAFESIRTAIYIWGFASIGLIFLGLICLMLQILFSNLSLKNIIINKSLDGIFTGLLMGIAGLAGVIFALLVPQYFKYSITGYIGNAPVAIQDSANTTLILEILKSILMQIALPVLIIGAGLFIVFLLIRLFMRLFKGSKKTEVKTEAVSVDTVATREEFVPMAEAAPASTVAETPAVT